jgi:single-stranded-DNA-specific exonuclease
VSPAAILEAGEWAPAPVPASSAALASYGRLAPLLARRGVQTPAEADAFLTPRVEHLHDPGLLSGMAAALDRLALSLQRGERVAVVGDYDADGVTSVALLTAVLGACGLEAGAILPQRLVEGYGFQPQHVERAVETGAGLIVTVDCGTNSTAAVAAAAAAGVDVIVTDHHLPHQGLAGAILVNPRQEGCAYPFPDLAGVGLAFKLAQGFLQRCGRAVPSEQLLRLASLGTIADLAPLRGENRVIASLGLRALARTRSAGLRALFARAGVQPPFSAPDVGFRIGPRLNAVGRLGSAEAALEILLTRDPGRAVELAATLDGANEERRREEAAVVAAARSVLSELAAVAAPPRFLAAWSEDWHPGVLGIAAGRLAREFHCPVVLFAVRGERATGSGRSIPGLDLHAFLARWSTHYERFGGHTQAIGMTLPARALDPQRRHWIDAARTAWPPEIFVRRWEYEIELAPEEVTPELQRELARLEPYGMGNPAPLLRVGPLRARSRRVFADKHLEIRPERGPALVLWDGAARGEEIAGDFEALATLEHDDWRGAPVLRVVALRAVG